MEWAKLLASIPRDANGAIKPIAPSSCPDPRLKLAHQKMLDDMAARNRAAAQRVRFIIDIAKENGR
jgi:hypothetical protein